MHAAVDVIVGKPAPFIGCVVAFTSTDLMDDHSGGYVVEYPSKMTPGCEFRPLLNVYFYILRISAPSPINHSLLTNLHP